MSLDGGADLGGEVDAVEAGAVGVVGDGDVDLPEDRGDRVAAVLPLAPAGDADQGVSLGGRGRRQGDGGDLV